MLGIITIAQGKRRYIDMSKMLALSLLENHPTIKRAVISDAPQDEFKGLFDIYIPYNKAFGTGLSQKLYLDKYSPFDETIFIDADCLVIKPLNGMIELVAPHSFVVFGDQISSGEWFMDVASICKMFNVPSIPKFNGGVYYFKKGIVADSIYNYAREVADRYTDMGLKYLNGSLNEEPVIAIAMAVNHVKATNDSGKGMRTPIGINGSLNVDVFKQYCRFIKNGVEVKPAILHFAGAYTSAFHYKREITKLKLSQKIPFINKKVISSVVNITFNSRYGLFVFCKRVLKIIIRREKFDFNNHLPVFSNY